MEESKKEKWVFWLRFSGWLIFYLIVPAGFLVWRFQLFQATNRITVGGWGFIFIVIIFTFLAVLLKYLTVGKTYRYYKQIIKGLMWCLPIGLGWFACYELTNYHQELTQFLGVLFISEVIAVFINPMPKWVYDETKGEMMSLIDYFTEKMHR